MHDIKRYEEEKLASMKEMMDNIAHQWRQPLSEINSLVGLLDNRLYELGVEDKILNEKLVEIELLTKYMSETIDDFKGYFGETNTQEQFYVDELIEKIVCLVEMHFKKYAIDLVVENGLHIALRGYPNELKQIILVLLNNAKDSVLKRNVHQATITLRVYQAKEHLMVEVCDNGGGMTQSVMKKIFEPYFTTKHKSQGTGLGLYMSKKIIQERFGGDIFVKNVHRGACFTIMLPLTKEKNAEI